MSSKKQEEISHVVASSSTVDKTSTSTTKNSFPADPTSLTNVNTESLKKDKEAFELFKNSLGSKIGHLKYLVETHWIDCWLNFVINE